MIRVRVRVRVRVGVRIRVRVRVRVRVMVDTPNDALQSHKVSGQYSPRGRVGGQKRPKNRENPEELNPGRRGGTGVGDHFGTFPPISISIDGTSPKLLW